MFSRRDLLKMAGLSAGAAIGTRLAGPSWIRNAAAANEKSAVVVVFCQGGYNQMFSSADSCVGRFGVTDAEVETIGNGLAIHKPTFGTLPAFTKQHMAAIGAQVPTGVSADPHGLANAMQHLDPNGVPWATRLAAAIGGDAALKAVHLAVDGNDFDVGNRPAVNGVSMQGVFDMGSILAQVPQIGVTPPPDPNKPDRAIHAAANKRVLSMSQRQLDANPTRLLTLREGYNTAQGLLERVPKAVDFNGIAGAYGINGSSSLVPYRAGSTLSALNAKFAAAEVLVRTGTNVVSMHLGEDPVNGFNYTFDSHAIGGTKGVHERHLMGLILPGLRTFTSRMLEDPDYNVVVLFIGDFARTNGQTDSGDETQNGHGKVISATVMGRYVKTGTTGKTYDAGYQDERLASGQPNANINELWSYVAAVAKVPTNPFGANPHNLVL